MTLSQRGLQRLLSDTDGQFNRGARPDKEIVSVLDLERRLVQRRSERRSQRRLWRSIMAVGLILLTTITASWWNGRGGTEKLDLVVDARPMNGAAESEYEQAIAHVKQKANLVANAAKMFRQDRRLTALHAEYRKLRRDTRSETRSPSERAAQISLNLAAEFDRQFGGAAMAKTEYQRIVEQFPNTASADLAKQRLALGDERRK